MMIIYADKSHQIVPPDREEIVGALERELGTDFIIKGKEVWVTSNVTHTPDAVLKDGGGKLDYHLSVIRS